MEGFSPACWLTSPVDVVLAFRCVCVVKSHVYSIIKSFFIHPCPDAVIPRKRTRCLMFDGRFALQVRLSRYKRAYCVMNVNCVVWRMGQHNLCVWLNGCECFDGEKLG